MVYLSFFLVFFLTFWSPPPFSREIYPIRFFKILSAIKKCLFCKLKIVDVRFCRIPATLKWDFAGFLYPFWAHVIKGDVPLRCTHGKRCHDNPNGLVNIRIDYRDNGAFKSTAWTVRQVSDRCLEPPRAQVSARWVR